MNVYVNTSFRGHYPVGVCAVVMAETAAEAAKLLEVELKEHGLKQEVQEKYMRKIQNVRPQAFVIQDGDY